MKTARFPSVAFRAVISLFCAAVSLTLSAQTFTDQTVVDQTSLMSDAAVTQINARNKQLFDATGLIIVVVVMRGTNGESALLDGIPAADTLAKGSYGALVWVATGSEKSDVVFTGKALKWVSYDEQEMLRHELGSKIRYCCPSDTLPHVVDHIASTMESASKVAPSPRNYIRDDLGMLTDVQLADIVAREQRLEAATGKGVGVVLFPEQPGKTSGMIAFSMAETFNVSGQIAALVWLARGQQASRFAVMQTPDFTTIPDATEQSISNIFQADMQTGKFGDAIVAAVDRTATAIEGTSTPMPQTPTPVQSPPAEATPAESVPSPTETPATRPGASGTGTAVVIFLAFAIIVLFVTLALRRKQQQ